MSGMYTMLPLTQVVREGERRLEKRKEGETATVLYISYKTGADDIIEDASGYEPLTSSAISTYT